MILKRHFQAVHSRSRQWRHPERFGYLCQRWLMIYVKPKRAKLFEKKTVVAHCMKVFVISMKEYRHTVS